MIRIQQLKLSIHHKPEALTHQVSKLLRIDVKQIQRLDLVRRSLDARDKSNLMFVYTVDVAVDKQNQILKKVHNNNIMSIKHVPYQLPEPGQEVLQHPPVIVGSGPAGLFCAYMLAKEGYQPIVIERGQTAAQRQKTVDGFWKDGILDPNSNVQFGEGGAGTFSDGKLNTLVKDPVGRNHEVLRIFVEMGAPEEILYDQKPHLGTDVLVPLVTRMREEIKNMGGQFFFDTCMTELMLKDGQLQGLKICHNRKDQEQEIINTQVAVLALGHSARDTITSLHQQGLFMESKSFAVGVRVEHLQSAINQSQYGSPQIDVLGAANYKLTHQAKSGRGVYSFCMCPGGYVVNASSEKDRLAINGMSYQSRNSKNANSALIVTVTPEDYKKYGSHEDPLAGMAFQRALEEKAYACANGAVPVQTWQSFREKNQNFDQGKIFDPCIKGAWAYGNVRQVLPDYITEALTEAIPAFGKKIKGYDRPDTLISGVESRTSSPVRMVRDDQSLESNLPGIYPCGEGAGYAGGITSAAMDGIKVAEAIVKKYRNFS